MEKYILFIDSGIGGLSTLAKTIEKVNSNYIYYADVIHSPYGDKTSIEITHYLEKIIFDLLQKYNINIVVLACNTATTSSIYYLRQKFSNIIFIGTEPAINLAKKLGYQKPLVIATPTTINQKKYLNLINNSNLKIKSLPLNNLAHNIEMYYYKKSIYYSIKILKDIFKLKNLSKNYDCMILGCTHYSLIKDKIKNYINIPLLDGNYGVCNQVQKYTPLINSNKSTIKFLCSYTNISQKEKYIKILKQILAKKINMC